MTNIVAHCPFCGGTVEDGTLERTHGGRNVMHNERDDCHSFRGMLIRLEAWNRRTPAQPSGEAPSEKVTTDVADPGEVIRERVRDALYAELRLRKFSRNPLPSGRGLGVFLIPVVSFLSEPCRAGCSDDHNPALFTSRRKVRDQL